MSDKRSEKRSVSACSHSNLTPKHLTPKLKKKNTSFQNQNCYLSPFLEFKFDEENERFSLYKKDLSVCRSDSSNEKMKTPLTDPIGFNLSTNKRANERSAFNSYKKQIDKDKSENKRLCNEELRKNELEELRQLRKNLEFKARPIGYY